MIIISWFWTLWLARKNINNNVKNRTNGGATWWTHQHKVMVNIMRKGYVDSFEGESAIRIASVFSYWHNLSSYTNAWQFFRHLISQTERLRNTQDYVYRIGWCVVRRQSFSNVVFPFEMWLLKSNRKTKKLSTEVVNMFWNGDPNKWNNWQTEYWAWTKKNTKTKQKKREKGIDKTSTFWLSMRWSKEKREHTIGDTLRSFTHMFILIKSAFTMGGNIQRISWSRFELFWISSDFHNQK